MAETRPYELMLILDPRLDDAVIQQAVDRFVGVIAERGGEATKVDMWGRRRLAFEINHLSEGYYVVAQLQAQPPVLTELDRVLGLADEVMRHKIVRPGKY